MTYARASDGVDVAPQEQQVDHGVHDLQTRRGEEDAWWGRDRARPSEKCQDNVSTRSRRRWQASQEEPGLVLVGRRRGQRERVP
jgi:hypothetical protein